MNFFCVCICVCFTWKNASRAINAAFSPKKYFEIIIPLDRLTAKYSWYYVFHVKLRDSIIVSFLWVLFRCCCCCCCCCRRQTILRTYFVPFTLQLIHYDNSLKWSHSTSHLLQCRFYKPAHTRIAVNKAARSFCQIHFMATHVWLAIGTECARWNMRWQWVISFMEM